jgi:UDP-N-acetylmuramoyl-tripeptide--D-alanyl-D-alanine ligase
MITWSAAQVAEAAGATLARDGGGGSGPVRAAIDTRSLAAGDLFAGLVGEQVDGGRFAADALAAGAWGVLVGPAHADGLPEDGAVLVAEDPLAALQRLATAWRRELDAAVIGVTGSVGKTSTKQLIAALVAPHRRVAANPANFNTEIGLPLAVLAAPPGTEVLVLEMGMRGFGQIDELARIAEPDVGVITNVGPVHVELVGSLAGVARAKAELLAHVPVAVLPADVPLLDELVPEGVDVVRFGTDVMLEDFDPPRVRIVARERVIELEVPFRARHQLVNLLAAVAAAQAVGVEPSGTVEVEFGAMRGEHVELASGVVVINDCYNANPLSMRAALDDLATQAPDGGRRVAVLGDMLELGPDEAREHAEVGAYAARSGVDVLVAVGSRSRAAAEAFGGTVELAADAAEAASVVASLVRPGDVVLVKASRGIGLEAVTEALAHG